MKMIFCFRCGGCFFFAKTQKKGDLECKLQVHVSIAVLYWLIRILNYELLKEKTW